MLTRTCSYVSQCARARVTSTDKYGKSSQERRRFSSIAENNSAINIDHRGFFADQRERDYCRQNDRRPDESRGFTNGRAETV